MATFLFDKIIFGPVQSRRLGMSLGINLLPVDKKFCNFDCIYCECGWSCNDELEKESLPERATTSKLLEDKIIEMANNGAPPDTITFAGNGEPTMHPDFRGIVEDTIAIRNRYCLNAKIAVLSNSTGLGKPEVAVALKQVDQCIMKLDTGNDDTYHLINRPNHKESVRKIIENLKAFGSGLIIQTMFFRGTFKGINIDNTLPDELELLLSAYQEIQPDLLMIYTYERDTASDTLQKVSKKELQQIAESIRETGIPVVISG